MQSRAAGLRDARGHLGVARQLVETIIGNLPAEIIAGDILDFVRLVENYRAVFGKHAAEIILLEREIGEKKMVIHDDQVGLGGALVHRREETLVELRAF